MYICTYISLYVRTYACIYMCIIYMYVYVYIITYIYKRTVALRTDMMVGDGYSPICTLRYIIFVSNEFYLHAS